MSEISDHDEMMAEIRRLCPLPPGEAAQLDQMKKMAEDLVDATILSMLNAQSCLEHKLYDQASDLSQRLAPLLARTPHLILQLAYNEMGVRLVRQLTRGYDTMADFKEALDAGKIEGYTSKCYEEQANDLFGLSPDAPPPLS